MNIIFDLDGTLLNTLDDLHNSVCHALASARLPKIDRLVTRRFLGNGVKSLIDNCVTHACPEANDRMKEEVFRAFRQHYMLHSMDKTAPYPGVVEMLRQCKESGLTTAIVSNKLNEAVQDLHRRFFAQYIDLAIGETPSVKRKPAPDMVYEAMRRLSDMKGKQIEKVDCVYVDDSEVDLQTATHAGLECIAVSWGFRDREWIEQCGAKVIIDTPSELLSTLPALAAKADIDK